MTTPIAETHTMKPNRNQLSAAGFLCLLAIHAFNLLGSTEVASQQPCKPNVRIRDIHASEPDSFMWRRWTTTLSVDASHCKSKSGTFEIIYAMQKENAFDFEVREAETWNGTVSTPVMSLWIDQFVAGGRVGQIANCECKP
jgi:hypothetical protein